MASTEDLLFKHAQSKEFTNEISLLSEGTEGSKKLENQETSPNMGWGYWIAEA